MIFVHDTAEVSEQAELGEGTKVWNLAQIRENARLGVNCIVSKNVYIDFEVVIGDNCKIQNNSSIYHGARLAHGVFIGPHCALLNDPMPRAINADGSLKSADDWTVAGVTVRKGAALGGGTIARPGVTIGALGNHGGWIASLMRRAGSRFGLWQSGACHGFCRS